MSDAEYDEIKRAFPKWAQAVKDHVEEIHDTDLGKAYNLGYLSGLAAAMILTGQCSRAHEFLKATEGRHD